MSVRAWGKRNNNGAKHVAAFIGTYSDAGSIPATSTVKVLVSSQNPE